MDLRRQYRNTRFSVETLRRALAQFFLIANPDKKKTGHFSFSLSTGDDTWSFDTEEEFFAEYSASSSSQGYYLATFQPDWLFRMDTQESVTITVRAPQRAQVLTVVNIFDSSAPNERVHSQIARPKVFIGHGPHPAWKDLKDHLHDKHDFEVCAYEVGARAGHAIRDILNDMLDQSSFALLVMMGDDLMATGELRPRDNVIHEAGLFQGRLWFNRAIVLLEEGASEFSNIHGIQQIRFSKANIKETFGEVVATINREFPYSQ